MRYLFIFLLFACSLAPEEEHDANDNSAQADLAVVSTEPEIIEPVEEEPQKKVLEPVGFDLVIYNYEAYTSFTSPNKDTLIIQAEMGEDLSEKVIEIIPVSDSDTYEVLFSLESQVMVYLDDDDVKELDSWKKIDGPHSLTSIAPKQWKTLPFLRGEKEKQLSQDFDTIKREILALGEQSLNDRIANADSIRQLPIELWISRAFIKVIRTLPNGDQKETLIINESGWGC